MISRSNLAFAAVIFAILAGGYLWFIQPGVQISRSMERLFAATADKNWNKVGVLLSEDYVDAWGMNKAQILTLAREGGTHFLALHVEGEGRVTTSGDSALWKGSVRFAGRGSPLGEAFFSRAAELKEPFVFSWVRESWKPWDWKLVSVAQPEIVMDSSWFQ